MSPKAVFSGARRAWLKGHDLWGAIVDRLTALFPRKEGDSHFTERNPTSP
ncbi:hypothetical protein [Burkholderia stagnalis]|nr:hypothetical protein [Burkholderia stagnalis]